MLKRNSINVNSNTIAAANLALVKSENGLAV